MSARHVGLLAALAAIWGGSYLLIKYALDGFSAASIVSFRCLLASGVLYAALRATGSGLPRGVPLKWATILGLTAVAFPFMLITFGEHVVPSGLTAVLISPASLFVAVFAPLIDPSERITRGQAVGLGLGLLGVAMVVGVESVHTLGEFLGALAMIGAAAFYGLSTFVVKGRFGAYASMQTSWISVSVAGVVTLPVALATTPGHTPTVGATASLLVLGVVGTALAFVIFYRLINDVGAGRASLVSYLAPGVALFYGAIFRGEAITVAAVGGLVFILGGVYVVASRRSGPDPVARRGGVPRRRPRVDRAEPSGARAEL